MRPAPSGGLFDEPLDGALSSAWLSHIYDAIDWLADRDWIGDAEEQARINNQIEILASWLRRSETDTIKMIGIPINIESNTIISGQVAFRLLRLGSSVVVRLEGILIGV